MHTVFVRDVISAYLRHSAATNLHCRTSLAERQYTFDLFTKEFGHLAVTDCRAFFLTDWIERNTAWKSISTRRQKASCIRAAFEWAKSGERIDRNPFANVRYGESERRPDLPDDTFERLATSASKPMERVLRFLRFTGCRVGELCRAEWQDVDLVGGLWTIHIHKTRKFTQRDKVVVLVPQAVALLRSLAGERAGAIFLNTRGKPWNRCLLANNLTRLKKRLGISHKASLHGIRHRFASAAIGAGASVKLVAEQLGHSTVATTERYYFNRSPDMLDSIRQAVRLGLPKEGAL